MVIEILSPSARRHDRLVKLNLSRRAGVKEYWIVSPSDQTAAVFMLKDGWLVPRAFYKKDGIVKVNVLEGCFIELSKVFRE